MQTQTKWILGGIVAFVLVVVLFSSFHHKNTTIAVVAPQAQPAPVTTVEADPEPLPTFTTQADCEQAYGPGSCGSATNVYIQAGQQAYMPPNPDSFFIPFAAGALTGALVNHFFMAPSYYHPGFGYSTYYSGRNVSVYRNVNNTTVINHYNNHPTTALITPRPTTYNGFASSGATTPRPVTGTSVPSNRPAYTSAPPATKTYSPTTTRSFSTSTTTSSRSSTYKGR